MVEFPRIRGLCCRLKYADEPQWLGSRRSILAIRFLGVALVFLLFSSVLKNPIAAEHAEENQARDASTTEGVRKCKAFRQEIDSKQRDRNCHYGGQRLPRRFPTAH